MDPDSGKLYTPDEVKEMTDEERAKLNWISQQEFDTLRSIDEDQRVKTLDTIRKADRSKRKRQRQQQKNSRRKNRNR